ncbi:MAG: hypothetical protein LUE14_12870 [Clostridiales bacterium]|nr:hypothetical protein [Clostridiales bacterium]
MVAGTAIGQAVFNAAVPVSSLVEASKASEDILEVFVVSWERSLYETSTLREEVQLRPFKTQNTQQKLVFSVKIIIVILQGGTDREAD